MPSKPREEDLTDELPDSINPYEVLGIESTASADDIKKAYRKAALLHHPDKASAEDKDVAHERFKEIAFAYAVLSDPKRRERYDRTGSTEESVIGDDAFDWVDFYRAQFEGVVTEDAVANFAKDYKGSDEEREALLDAYEKYKGDMNKIYSVIMVSNPLEDEDRFQELFKAAIESGEVEAYKAFTEEPEKRRQSRIKKARQEAKEAEQEKEKGAAKKGKKKGGAGDLSDLAALIQRKNQGSSFLDRLEAKYASEQFEEEARGKKKKVGGKKRKGVEEAEEPPEELFQANQKKLDERRKKARRVEESDESEEELVPKKSRSKTKTKA